MFTFLAWLVRTKVSKECTFFIFRKEDIYGHVGIYVQNYKGSHPIKIGIFNLPLYELQINTYNSGILKVLKN